MAHDVEPAGAVRLVHGDDGRALLRRVIRLPGDEGRDARANAEEARHSFGRRLLSPCLPSGGAAVLDPF